MYRNSTIKINNNTHTLSFKQKIKETSPQISGSDTESLLENQTRSKPVQCLNDSKKKQHEIQRNETNVATYDSGDDNIFPPKKTTSQIKQRLVRDDITIAVYKPLSSTIVLKRKKEKLHVPLDLKNGLTIDDALIDSGAYVSARAQKLHPVSSKSMTLLIYGQLEKPIATATLKFDVRDHTFAEDFVVMRILTGPIIRLHFMRHNSVVIDTTHALIRFPHLTN